MKKITIYIFAAILSAGIFSSCDKGYDELNINPVAVTTLNPLFLLNNAVISSGYGGGGPLVYDAGIVQQIVTPNSGVLAGANFNQDNKDVTRQHWQAYYRNVVRYTVDIIDKTKTDATRSNLYHMARIWNAYAMMSLTDTYGDIPYKEAGKAFLEGTTSPKYDTQESIYTDLIKELSEASAALDAAKTRESGDVLYGGDITKWKRLGYSLLLRAGMRLTKVDAARAQQVAQQAFQGGVMQTNADNCAVRFTTVYTNPIGSILNTTEANNYYLGAPFVNYLKATRDPRLGAIAVRYVGAASGAQQVAARASRDTTVQIGMPVGFDNGSIPAQATAAKLASFYDYSQADRTRIGKIDGACFLVTAAQTQLLLAEAAQRGWVAGSATDFYNAGVRAGMAQMAEHDASMAIATSAVDAYLTRNPFVAARGLELINTQYWVVSFMNGPEAFANFRRSGFPALTPNPYAGKAIKGQFIRRLTYPDSEFSVNKANIDEAVKRMGANDLDTRVWWDK